ncbi:hypothetical protein AGOR_G00222040 [Albula goreensis]|uniref:Phosphoinositide 3-kinase regulatory subunit 5 n=1 Tax=Albula goreensis TaxID=1534307 RepID=A0A8T3CHI2_9TELE|nr:hypothetical protein AGOR_G00222040 [Albula goreensis]
MASGPPSAGNSGNASLCMNRWSLEELVRRDPENFLILLRQILSRAREVQEQCRYELVTPLVLMFSSCLLLTPYLSQDCPLLADACEVFSSFLSWPEPYCGVCQDLLTTLRLELKAPGLSYHRLVREEQGLSVAGRWAKTMTVLLVDPADVPPDLVSVSEQLSSVGPSPQEIHATLIKHAFQAAFGATYPLPLLHQALQSKSLEELEQLSSKVTEAMEASASMEEPEEARRHLLQGLEQLRDEAGLLASGCRKPDGDLQMFPLPVAKCHVYHWDSDTFDVLEDIFEQECCPATIVTPPDAEQEEDTAEEEEEREREREENGEETEEEECSPVLDSWPGHRASTLSTLSTLSNNSRDSMFSTCSATSSSSALSWLSEASGADSDFCEDGEDSPPERITTSATATPPSRPRLRRQLSKLFKSRGSGGGGGPVSRAKSLGSPEMKAFTTVRPARFGRSNSLPKQGRPVRLAQAQAPPQTAAQERVRFRRSTAVHWDGSGRGGLTVRVVAFGSDRSVGKVARAYSHLRARESGRPVRLQLFFVPVDRGGAGCAPGGCPFSPEKMPESPPRGAPGMDVGRACVDGSTNDIARFMGMMDPWYERNVLSFLGLPVDALCQKSSRTETDPQDGTRERLPIFADLVLYYCRQATRPALVQLYQAELTLAGGERRTEVFVHSLELGHTAGTRAVKATRAASKRFGIDGDREAIPLTLELLYNKVTVSGRNHWIKADKVCTSINLTKACKIPEELGSRTEWLQMAVTEVLKRQNSKSKMGYNQQLCTTEVKVDQVQVSSGGTSTFAVCLDQDERKVLQSVTRCEVSVLCENGPDWRPHTDPSDPNPAPLPTVCSLLCLPLATFSGARP